MTHSGGTAGSAAGADGIVTEVGPWWDDTLAAEPPNQEFLFVGVEQDAVGECVYRFSPDEPPESVFCPGSGQSEAVRIGATEQARPGQKTLLLVATTSVSDAYPATLYRVDVTSGNAEALSEFMSAPYGGPQREVLDVLSLDDERYVALVEQDREMELLVGTTTLHFGYGLRVPGNMGSLRGVLSSGEVVVGSERGVMMVDIDASPMEIAQQTDSVYPGNVSPDGTAVAYWGSGALRSSLAGVMSLSANWEHEVTVGFIPAPGWINADSLLVSAGDRFLAWAYRDDQLAVIEADPDHTPRGSYRTGPDALAYVASDYALDPVPEGVGWYKGGIFAPMCGRLERVRTIGAIDGAGAAIALLDNSQELGGEWLLDKIYSCRPGGEPVDLLAPHNMRGRLLVPAEELFD